MFFAIDLKSSYHQIELHPQDRLYTIGKWLVSMATITIWAYQCNSEILTNYQLLHQEKGCNYYPDDVTISGNNQEHHDEILNPFLKAAAAAKMTINKNKTLFLHQAVSIALSTI